MGRQLNHNRDASTLLGIERVETPFVHVGLCERKKDKTRYFLITISSQKPRPNGVVHNHLPVDIKTDRIEMEIQRRAALLAEHQNLMIGENHDPAFVAKEALKCYRTLLRNVR